jgi:DNA-binding PadR family transcriptional regulator
MTIEMFDPLSGIIEYFQEKGATTPEKALALDELGIPEEMEQLIPPVLPDMFPIVRVGNKYYLSKERLEKFREQGGFINPIKKWIQHTAKVPKGFLRYQVLHRLREQPMSGAELTSAIEEEIGGRWKPKPGSMYPLLRALLRDGLTREVPDEDGRTRRYELTERGQKFLEDQIDQSGELREKIAQSFTPFPMPFLPMLGSNMENPSAIQNLFEILQDLRIVMGSNPSPQILKELAQSVDRFAKDLKEIRKKIENKETNTQ